MSGPPVVDGPTGPEVPGRTTGPGDPSAGGVDLTAGNVWRQLVHLSVPMLAGAAIQTGYSLVNAVWVGRGLGTDAMAAITVSFPVFFLLLAVAGGLTQASAILVAQAFGARDLPRVRAIVQNSIVLTLAVAIVCVLIGMLGAEAILAAMQTPASVLPVAVAYMRWYILTVPFMFGLFLLASILRGVGDATTPVRFQFIALVGAAVLDPILMFGWLGLPRFGLNGTAIASVITQVLALAALSWRLRRQRHVVAPAWRTLRLDGPTVWLTLKIGVPSMLQQALVSVGMMVLTGLVGAYGRNAIAAFGAAMRIDQLAFMPAMTVGMAVTSMAGQNLGAGRHDRIGQIFRCGIALAGGITAIASLLALIVPAAMLRCFVAEPAVIAIGVGYLHRIALGYLMFAVFFVSNGIINGSGHTLATTLFTMAGVWLVRLPLAAWLSHRYHRIEVIWWAMLLGFAIGMSASVAYYLSGRWRRPVGPAAPVAAGGA